MVVPRDEFPNPEDAGPDGLLAMGGDLHPQTLLKAYRAGAFPWPIEGLPLTWFCPAERAILRFKDLHLSRSLKRSAKQQVYRLTLNQDFRGVIQGCAEAERPLSDEELQWMDPSELSSRTWITAEMMEAYCRFHEMGFAHSAEAWDGEDLIGGIYGVAVDGVFSAESMFYRKKDASKLALVHLVEHLKSRGLEWMDIQMMTPHMQRFGASTLPRQDYLQLLRNTQKKNLQLFESKNQASLPGTES